MKFRIIDFFFHGIYKRQKKTVYIEEDNRKQQSEYFKRKISSWNALHQDSELKFKKTSIAFSQKTLEFIMKGNYPDQDHKHQLFFFDNYLYFYRWISNSFLGKAKVVNFSGGYRIVECYYANYGDEDLLFYLLEEAILLNALTAKEDLQSFFLIGNKNEQINVFIEESYFGRPTCQKVINVLDKNYWKSILLGIAVSDAHGVPFEFRSRESMQKEDLTNLTGYGMHNKPLGTHSDDTSLTLCLAEALLNNNLKLNRYENIIIECAGNFNEWLNKGKWAVKNEIFDVGNTTRNAILRYNNSNKHIESGGKELFDNGNGALMRILPLCIYLYCADRKYRLNIVTGIASLTHAHEISIISCLYYILFAIQIIENHEQTLSLSLHEIYFCVNQEFNSYYIKSFSNDNMNYFNRIIGGELANLKESEIKSGGFVVDTLEASIWSLLNSNSFPESVIKAIKLGGDSDTTGAVTGGISGLYYGQHNIPENWINDLIEKESIIELANKLSTIEFRKNTPNSV